MGKEVGRSGRQRLVVVWGLDGHVELDGGMGFDGHVELDGGMGLDGGGDCMGTRLYNHDIVVLLLPVCVLSCQQYVPSVS